MQSTYSVTICSNYTTHTLNMVKISTLVAFNVHKIPIYINFFSTEVNGNYYLLGDTEMGEKEALEYLLPLYGHLQFSVLASAVTCTQKS